MLVSKSCFKLLIATSIGVFLCLYLKSLSFGTTTKRATNLVHPVEKGPSVMPSSPNASDLETDDVVLEQQETLGEHYFRSDGLVDVNEDGPHPIFELMARAEKSWNDKLKRASKSLDEAVTEYQRRYHRNPPRGFDHWWNYVVKHNVQLPDEYDQIYHDLEPFWGIEPADLLQLRSEVEWNDHTYILGKTLDSPVHVMKPLPGEFTDKQRIRESGDILDLFKDIEEFLPPFDLTMKGADGPNLLTDFGIKDATLGAASAKTYIKRSALPKPNPIGWVSACSPASLARRTKIGLDNPPPRPISKTFIHDHLATMNPCLHPTLFHHHGQFLGHGSGPSPQKALFPEFGFCSTNIHHNIRIPTPYLWVEDIYPRSNDPEWDDKLDERLLWRGSTTGIYHADHIRWRHSHRTWLVQLANELNGTTEIFRPPSSKEEKLGETKVMRNSRLNPALMDIAFSDTPIACKPPACTQLKEGYRWTPRQGLKEAGNYKYVLDVDGNGWSGRFKRLITSNSLIFKSTIYPEWFSDRIAPWVHYVPVQVDLSDLHDALIFFRGDPNGEGAHEDLARQIALAGRQWSKALWRREDLTAYFFRLILEYARLMSLDREAMSYSGISVDS